MTSSPLPEICTQDYYRLTHLDQKQGDLTQTENIGLAPIQEFWWEEVDRVFPLDADYSMNTDQSHQRSETPNPTREAENLERFGQVGDDAVGTDPIITGPPEEPAQGLRGRQKAATAPKKDDKKKRRRSASEKNAAKKSKNAQGGNKSGKPGNNNKANANANDNTGDSDLNRTKGKAANPEKAKQDALRKLRQQQREARREGSAEPPESGSARASTQPTTSATEGASATNPGTSSNARPQANSSTTTGPQTPRGRSMPHFPRMPTPGRMPSSSPVNNLLRPPTFSHSPMGNNSQRDNPPPRGPISLMITGPGAPDDDEDITEEGLAREQHRRLIEANNPVPELPAKKKGEGENTGHAHI